VRIAFLGNDPWSVPPLRALSASSHPVALVVTRVPRPAGRGGKPRRTAVAEAAGELALPLREVETVKRGEGLDALRDAGADVLVVVAYGEILPEEVLGLAYPVNVHFSLLPALRGADPVRRAVLEGHAETGVTIMRMDRGMDTGPVLLQASEPVGDEDDAGSLGARLAELGGRLLVEALDRRARGALPERAQGDGATLAPKLTAEDEWIDWNEDATAVWRRIRALAPDPGARTRFREKLLKVLVAAPVTGDGRPGEVVEVTNDGFSVAAGKGAVAVREVLPEGRKRITAADFVRGYHPEAGERLGA
jgi:methionyl-tRNA formyltransferase